MSIYQVSVFVENKKGRLADIAKVLADNNINIRALSIADTTNFGILRLIVDDPQKAEAALKANNFTVSLTHVIAIEIPDVAGGLLQALEVLNSENISIEYMYAFIDSTEGKAAVVMRVEDRKAAADLLDKHGFKTIEG